MKAMALGEFALALHRHAPGCRFLVVEAGRTLGGHHRWSWFETDIPERERALMAGLASSLKVPSEEVPARVATLVDRLKVAERELERGRLATARAAAANAAAGAERVGDVRLVAQRMAGEMSAGDLRALVGDIRGKFGGDAAVVALIAEGENGAVPYVVAATPAAQDLGLRASDLVKAVSAAVDGRGGGKADLAQGSGKNPAGIDAALEALRAEVARS